MKRIIAGFWLILLLAPVGCIHFDRSAFQTVASVDLNAFMGDWYVLANIPTSLEEGAVNAIESYAMRDDGDIDITFKFNQDTVDGNSRFTIPKVLLKTRKPMLNGGYSSFGPSNWLISSSGLVMNMVIRLSRAPITITFG